jgi:heme/copper-type cytochrome/quinol oxidase subunit 2
MFFFAYLIPELILVFILIAIVLIFLLVYTCVLVFTTKWDKYKVQKEWEQVEELEKIQKRFF